MKIHSDSLSSPNMLPANDKKMWEGKVAFITGAGSPHNIGGTTARAFAALGVQTVLF